MGRIKNPDLLREKVKKIESKIKAIVETPYHRGKHHWRIRDTRGGSRRQFYLLNGRRSELG